jgi:hypothetical protein
MIEVLEKPPSAEKFMKLIDLKIGTLLAGLLFRKRQGRLKVIERTFPVLHPPLNNHPVPKVGDTVRLNDHGIRMIWGSRREMSAMKQVSMNVTYVGSESLGETRQIFRVGVDNETINAFFIDHLDFDVVRRQG